MYTAFLNTRLDCADLSGAICEMINAGDANFEAVRADASSWTRSVLTTSVWRRASLKAARLMYCDLSHADLSGADCTYVDFRGTNLHALIEQAAQFGGASFNEVRRTDPVLARAEQWQPHVWHKPSKETRL
ncbi:pentapeptide repeat-containing protein [Paraburkholderia youngii]|uniref:pentapeptide repeat-containing protein n=1 Tax=Paraburkholderia youngii TaxID=2782701 RepID=UPI003D1DFC6B